MTTGQCQQCGRPPEPDGTRTHHLGCRYGPEMTERTRQLFSPDDPAVEAYCITGCGKRTKPYTGRGARPQYCDDCTVDKRKRKKEVSNG